MVTRSSRPNLRSTHTVESRIRHAEEALKACEAKLAVESRRPQKLSANFRRLENEMAKLQAEVEQLHTERTSQAFTFASRQMAMEVETLIKDDMRHRIPAIRDFYDERFFRNITLQYLLNDCTKDPSPEAQHVVGVLEQMAQTFGFAETRFCSAAQYLCECISDAKRAGTEIAHMEARRNLEAIDPQQLINFADERLIQLYSNLRGPPTLTRRPS
jgi:hypothetical protein